MRGGVRSGAGRKKGEPTVRLSVPLGAVDDVKKLIANYQLFQQLKKRQTIKQPQEQQTVEQPSKPVQQKQRHEIKQKPQQEKLQAIRALLERKLKPYQKKAIIKVHGSIFNAVRDGVRIVDGDLSIPPHLVHRYESLNFELSN